MCLLDSHTCTTTPTMAVISTMHTSFFYYYISHVYYRYSVIAHKTKRVNNSQKTKQVVKMPECRTLTDWTSYCSLLTV